MVDWDGSAGSRMHGRQAAGSLASTLPWQSKPARRPSAWTAYTAFLTPKELTTFYSTKNLAGLPSSIRDHLSDSG